MRKQITPVLSTGEQHVPSQTGRKTIQRHLCSDPQPMSLAEEEAAWYLNRFRGQAPLNWRQEQEMLRRLARGDNSTKEALVRAYMPMVAELSAEYLERGLPLADLLQEGILSLLQTIEDFDPQRRFRLVARKKIRRAMQTAVQESRPWLKNPQTSREQTRNATRSPMHLFQENDCSGTDDETIYQARVGRAEDGIRLLGASGPPLSLDAARRPRDMEGSEDDEPYEPTTLLDQFQDTVTSEEEILLGEERDYIKRALFAFSPKDQIVLCGRYGLLGRTESLLQAIGHELHVTPERVRQREERALRTLRTSRHPALLELRRFFKETRL